MKRGAYYEKYGEEYIIWINTEEYNSLKNIYELTGQRFELCRTHWIDRAEMICSCYNTQLLFNTEVDQIIFSNGKSSELCSTDLESWFEDFNINYYENRD